MSVNMSIMDVILSLTIEFSRSGIFFAQIDEQALLQYPSRYGDIGEHGDAAAGRFYAPRGVMTETTVSYLICPRRRFLCFRGPKKPSSR